MKRLIALALFLLIAWPAQAQVALSPVAKQQFFLANGQPDAGGKLCTYQAGTTTPLATYTDHTGGTPNTNPIILDGGGFAQIWVTSATNYKFVLYDSTGTANTCNGNLQWSVDYVSTSGAQTAVTSLNSLTGAITIAGAGNITVTPSGNTLTISGSGTLGNSTTVIDVAALTPAATDLSAATATAIAACTATPACTYDYRGYAGKTITWLKDPEWPQGSVVLAPVMTWTLPLGVSVIPPAYGAIHGPNLPLGSTWGTLSITKLNTSTDYTPTILVPPNSTYCTVAQGCTVASFELDHFQTGATTKSVKPAYAITSTVTSTATTSLTSGFYVSGATVTGAAQQTCTLSSFNGGGTGAAATVALNGPNALGPASLLTITAIGSGYSAAPTTATLGNGSAVCSGTVTVVTQTGKEVVNGTFTNCATNACAGRQASIHGTVNSDGAGYQIYASTSTTITISNPNSTGETPPNNYPTMFAPYITIDGGYGFENLAQAEVTDDVFHDIAWSGDMGFGWLGSGCNCYNSQWDIITGGGDSHLGGYFGGNTYSNWTGFSNLGATDQATDGYAAAFGMCFWEIGGGSNIFEHDNLESCKYSVFLSNGVIGDSFPSTYFENDQTNTQSGQNGRVSFPTLFNNSQHNSFVCGNGAGFDVNDLTASAGYINSYCNFNGEIITTGHPSNYGSVSKTTVPQTIANQPRAVCPSGACGTSYQYYEVIRDWNAGACGGGAAVIGCSTPVTLTPVSNNASLDSTHYNYVYRLGNSLPRTSCIDILYPDTSHYIAKCVSPFVDFIDDGTYASTAYTANTRDMTADQTSTGKISASLFGSTSPCAAKGSAANPSLVACAAAISGSFSCDPAATGATCVVSTTAVTASSSIIVNQTAAKGTLLSVTCNTGNDLPGSAPIVASQSAGTSFTINLGTVTTNPACFDYWIIN